MNIIVKTDAGNCTFQDVTKIQELNGKLNLTVKKSEPTTKKAMNDMTKILSYMKIEVSMKEYASSIDVTMTASPLMKIEILTI